jgi:hypothetical protein
MTARRLNQEAWDESLREFRTRSSEVIFAELTRVVLTGSAAMFYQKYLVPRGFPPLSQRALSNMLLLHGELPSEFGKLIDSAIIAGYHTAIDPNTARHVAAVDHLQSRLHSLKQVLLEAAHLKKANKRRH